MAMAGSAGTIAATADEARSVRRVKRQSVMNEGLPDLAFEKDNVYDFAISSTLEANKTRENYPFF
jgi:hypothetical protein